MLFSIIIPAYNAEKTILRCLDSLIAQEFDTQQYEIIVIDDGSNDCTLSLCKNYSNKYSNLIVMNQQNAGPSRARNVGIKKAKGDYVIFVDSDDWVEERFLMSICSRIESHDMLVHGCTCDFYNKSYTNKLNSTDTTNISQLVANLDSKYLFSAPWLCVFKKAILDRCNLFFNENLRYSEDVCFAYNFLLHVDDIIYLDNTEYHYNNTNVKSITRGYVKDRYPQCKTKIDLRNKVYEKFSLSSDLCTEHCKEAITDEILGCAHNFAMIQSGFSRRDSATKILNMLNDKELMQMFESEYHSNNIKAKCLVKWLDSIRKLNSSSLAYILVIVFRVNDFIKGRF